MAGEERSRDGGKYPDDNIRLVEREGRLKYRINVQDPRTEQDGIESKSVESYIDALDDAGNPRDPERVIGDINAELLDLYHDTGRNMEHRKEDFNEYIESVANELEAMEELIRDGKRAEDVFDVKDDYDMESTED